MSDLSIVIPVYNEWPHIFYTVHSVMSDLEYGNIDYEIIIVDNGSELEEKEKIEELCKHYPIKLASYGLQSAMLTIREGVRLSKGKVVCILNAHALVSKNYFIKTCGLIEDGEADGVYAPLSYGWSWPLDSTHTKTYQFYLEPYCGDEKFGVGYSYDKLSEKHYKVASAPNHGFCFLRDAWFKIGEVNDGLLYCGGGCEIYVSLKMWMFGYELVLEPNVTAMHFNSPRRYPPTPNYYGHRNSFITYYILGGYQYAEKLYDLHSKRALKIPGYLSSQFGLQHGINPIMRCLEEAVECGGAEREFIENNSNIKFHDLWDWFDRKAVYWRK
jgi:glycosyltransferase involved in cell wall biosynthesis